MAQVARALKVSEGRNIRELVARLMQGRVGLNTMALEGQHIADRVVLPFRDQGEHAIRDRVGLAMLARAEQAAHAQTSASNECDRSGMILMNWLQKLPVHQTLTWKFQHSGLS